MNDTNEILEAAASISEAEELVAQEVERVFVLKTAKLDTGKAEERLARRCAALASRRVRLSQAVRVAGRRRPRRAPSEGADVGGPRWKIGWASLH